MAAECQRLYQDLKQNCSRADNVDDHAEVAPQIFMRNSPNDRVVGPFGEAELQAWYRTGWFHSGTEFRFGNERIFTTLAELRRINGPACPFIWPFIDGSYFERILEQVAKVLRISEETEFACEMLTKEVKQLKSDNDDLRRQLHKKGIMEEDDECYDNHEFYEEEENHLSNLPSLGDAASTSEARRPRSPKDDDERTSERDARESRTTYSSGMNTLTAEEEATSRTVFARNLDDDCTCKQLGEHFRSVGNVRRVSILRHENGTSKGCAFVEFSDRESREKALEMNWSSMMGRRLQVVRKVPLRRNAENALTRQDEDARR